MEGILTNEITPFDASGELQITRSDILPGFFDNNPLLGAVSKVAAMSSYGFEELLSLSTQEISYFSSGFDSSVFLTQNTDVFSNGVLGSNLELNSGITANTVIDEVNGDSLIGINGNQPLAGIFNFDVSINSDSTVGTLDGTDPDNPNRLGRFRDDYLLRGVSTGQQIQVNLNSSEFDTYLQLINADTGQVINFNDDGGPGLNSQLTFNVEGNVDYIVRATSFWSGATGEYTLTTSAGSTIPATPIMGDQTVTGILDNSDPNNPTRSGSFSDDYLLRGVAADQQVQVNLNAGFDTYLQLVNADNGQVIYFNDDGGPSLNSQLTFTAENGIDYILRVTSYSLGATGEYTLTTNASSQSQFQLDSIQYDWIDGWNLWGPDDQHFIGDFNDDGIDDVFMRKPEYAGLLTYNGAGFQLDSIQYDWIDSWNLSAADQHFVGNFDGVSGDDVFIRSSEWAGLLTHNGSSFQLDSIQYDWIDGWNLWGPDDQHFIGDFNGDGKDDVFMRKPEYAGLLTYNGTGFQLNSIQHDWIDGWNLSAVDQHFIGDFNGDGTDNVFIRSPEWAGMFSYNDGGFQLNSIQHDWIGGWNLGGGDQHFVGNFNGVSGDDVFIRSPEWVGLLSYNTPIFNATYGYGLVNAAAAVAQSLAQPTFADVPNLGGNQWGNDLVNAPEVWAQGFTGQGVTVAVIDSGVDINHVDLTDNIWTNPGEIAGNGIDDDGNGFIDDVNGWNFGNGGNNNVLPGTTDPGQGHGTHVAGTIAAMDNNLGATGVAHDAQIMAIRMGDVVTGTDGIGRYRNRGNLANAIRYAVDNGANVINMSLRWRDSTALGDALAYAAANNVITIMSAGNSGASSPDQAPARYATQFGISVGAVDRNGNIWSDSNRAGSDSNMEHVVAPGVDVFSTIPGNRYQGGWQGTSMAAPHIAGVVALMLSANPNLNHTQVRQILTDSAIALA